MYRSIHLLENEFAYQIQEKYADVNMQINVHFKIEFKHRQFNLVI